MSFCCSQIAANHVLSSSKHHSTGRGRTQTCCGSSPMGLCRRQWLMAAVLMAKMSSLSQALVSLQVSYLIFRSKTD